MLYVKSFCSWFSNYNYFPMSQFFFTLINIFIPLNGTNFSPLFTKKNITYAQIVGKLLCKVSVFCVYQFLRKMFLNLTLWGYDLQSPFKMKYVRLLDNLCWPGLLGNFPTVLQTILIYGFIICRYLMSGREGSPNQRPVA